MRLNIVLVEPQIPQNTGNIARTCAATGARLHLVGPMGFVVDDSKLKRAGLDYWHLLDISYYGSISEFFETVSKGVLGENETAPDTAAFEFHYFSTKSSRLYTEPSYKDNAFLFFGSETKGLDESLLRKNLEQCVRLPMVNDARSLNLSNAVAIGVFEVLRQWGFPNLLQTTDKLQSPINLTETNEAD
ncbi:MAG: tRNA (cytidine(34)-2'-O)-methyltransferase [Oscillospiraceae bacterium]|nr:tRNA (cytidine(34)-2'-O)-methyltransferase [Oscillospiraceae bacterium]